jgi:hypothetical protein
MNGELLVWARSRCKQEKLALVTEKTGKAMRH